MKKQIKLEIKEENVIAYINDNELFRLNKESKTIDIEQLYNALDIAKDDILENKIAELNSSNKTSIEVLYDNAKLFLDDLIKKINDVLATFDVKKEEENLIRQ